MHPITTAVVIVLVPLAIGWLSRGRRVAAAREAGVLVLEYAREWRTVTSACTLALVVAPGLVLLFTSPDPPKMRTLVGTMVFFGLLLVPGIIEVFGVHHRFDSHGLSIISPWRRRRHIGWSDVVKIEWSQIWMSYVVHTRDGRRLRLFYGLSGFGDFAALVLRHVAPAALAADPAARARLRAARRRLHAADGRAAW